LRVCPSGFIEPCQPSKVARPPSGPLWVHEIKHDGYRLMVRRDGARVRCFTRNGHDWADRFPAIVEAAARLQAPSFLIDGEAVIARDAPDFHALRNRRRGHEAVLFAFRLGWRHRVKAAQRRISGARTLAAVMLIGFLPPRRNVP
jgi:ATP-dependent DNA ligase